MGVDYTKKVPGILENEETEYPTWVWFKLKKVPGFLENEEAGHQKLKSLTWVKTESESIYHSLFWLKTETKSSLQPVF